MAGYIGSKASVVSSGAERKKVFSITSTTTSLTGLAYTPNQVHVYHNGIRLVDGTDYTATNGTTITLTTAAENGDQVVVISYASFQTSDTVSASAGGTFNNTVSVLGDLNIADKIVHSGNTNASIRFPVADTVTVETSGAEQMRIDSSGNVGIGTTSPAGKLHVAGSVVIGNANTYNELIFSGTEYTNLYSETTSGFDIGTNSTSGSSYLRFLTENTERLRLDASGNLGLGVTPSAWGGTAKAFEFPGGSLVGFGTGSQEYWYNAFYNGTNTVYKFSGTGAMQYKQTGTGHSFFTAPSGTAGNTITFTQAMTLDASGNLGIGTSTPGSKVEIFSPASDIGVGNFALNTNSTSGASRISFKELGSTVGQVAYSHDNNNLELIANESGSGIVFYTDGTNERMRINSSGLVTIPNQPMFQAGSNTGDVSYSTGAIIPFNVKRFDRGNNFNTSTYRFTAPVAGAYFFVTSVYAFTGRVAITLFVNGVQATGAGGDVAPYAFKADSTALNDLTVGFTYHVILNAGDYVSVNVRDGYSTRLYGGHSTFSGHFLG